MTNLPSFFTTAGLKVPADSNPSPLGFLRWRNGDLRGPRRSRRVVQDEIELARGELVGTGGVEQIEIDQHQLTVVDMPESLEHKIHPQRFAGTVDFLTDVSGHAAEAQRSEGFGWNQG